MAKLDGKTALITGAAVGLGEGIAEVYAKYGARLCLVDIMAEVEATAERLRREYGAEIIALVADVADKAQMQAAAAQAVERFGRLDILVNNAGIARDGLLMTAKEEDFSQTLDTNLKGAYFCTKAAAKVMLRQKYGRIVCLSSVVGLRGNPGQTAYAASKAGVIGLVKAAAKELAGRDITVNAVAPGFIETDMTAVLPEKAKAAMLGTIPKGRPGSPEEVARAVAFFAGPECAYITGQVLCVDGGMAV